MSDEGRPDAFNAFEAAGWESKAGGYDDFFGQITTPEQIPAGPPFFRFSDDREFERLLGDMSVKLGSGRKPGRSS